MSELSNNTDILSNFPPCLRPNIEELCLGSKIGFLPVNLEEIGITRNSNYYLEGDVLNNYHFILRVPYAGKKLKWEVIFDPEDFYFAPDFDFNDDTFLSFPTKETINDNVPSWKNWNVNNPKSLSQILNELLVLYKNQQIEKLHLENMYSRYSDEYKTLITNEVGIDAENVQVSVEGNNIVFLIALKLDCSSLPEYIQPILYKGNNMDQQTLLNQHDDFCHLKVTISKLDGSRSNYSMQLSSRLEQILGNFRFSGTEFKKDTPLIEIVASVSATLDSKLQQIVNHYKLKKVYILQLAAACDRTIIEYDVLTFNKAVFLYNIDDYHCLVTVSIGAKFPQEKPSVVLNSIYCPDAKPCSLSVEKYPYNSGKKPETNIENLLGCLHDIVLAFKNHKH